MKILVIDDTQKHIDAALQSLIGHEVTTCSSHDEAATLLWHEKWDAVLCDLLMPAGSNAQGNKGRQYVGQEMPVGWSLALHAVMGGAKYVAVVTDMNHHNHPASAMLDAIGDHIFMIDNARMLMTNSVNMVGIKGTEIKCDMCKGVGKLQDRDCSYCDNGIDYAERGGKDWGKILDQLIDYVVE